MNMNKKPRTRARMSSWIPFESIEEIATVFVLNILLGLVVFAYGVARSLKDGYLVTLGGANLVTFVKLFFVVPFMGILWSFYHTINKRTNMNGRFYALSLYFLAFFGIFFLVEYIGIEQFQLNMLATWEESHPRWRAVFQCLHYWPQIAFYLHAEAVGTFMLSVLVWTFINAIMTIEQSKRLYSLLTLGAAVATFFAGDVAMRHSKQSLIVIVACSIALLMTTYYFFQLYRESHPATYPPLLDKKKKKKKLTFRESLEVIRSSRYLLLIGTVVFCYAAFMPLVEAIHKDLIKSLSKVLAMENGVQYFTGLQLKMIGAFSIFLWFFVAPFVGRLSWFTRAILTPAVLIACSSLFFYTIFYTEQVQQLLAPLWIVRRFHIPITPAHMRVWAGMFLVVMGKSCKYLFFDATKEATYVPLDTESKVNAKAAIDSVIARSGKSFGAGFVIIMITLLKAGSSLGVKGYIIAAVLVVASTWLLAVLHLSRFYEQLTSQKKDADSHATSK